MLNFYVNLSTVIILLCIVVTHCIILTQNELYQV